MKINVYQEQYKSSQAHHDPGKVGHDFDLRNLGNTLVNAAANKLAQDDEFNSARIEADTMLAASKMYREYLETANPDDFEGDIETQRGNIQNLIQQQSQKFKLPKSQNAFIEKMTRGLEEQYMGNTLKYSYDLQEIRYKEKSQEATDTWKAVLLEGDTFVTVYDVMKNMREYYTTLAKRYHIPQDRLDAYIKEQNTSIVKSYAYGMIDRDPATVRDLLIGNSFEKFRTYKESKGEGFDMETFWKDENLRKEYQESEFGAQWTDIVQYLDYDTRVDLWKMANNELNRQEREAAKQKLLQNSMSDWEIKTKKKAVIAQIHKDGKMLPEIMGSVTIDQSIDPRLGTKGKPLAMGAIEYGPLNKGNKFTKNAEDFAKSISGVISAKGYKTYLTSSLRPGDKTSKHVDGSAADIQVMRNGELNEQGLIAAYKAAITNHGNNLGKGGTLFEVDPSRLKAIKAQLEAEGIDTSYVNWKQSEEYGEIAFRKKKQHIHFGIDKNADYTVTNSGKDVNWHLKTKLGLWRYQQQYAEGKSPQECYDAARQDELEIFTALEEYNLTQKIVTSKNADGTSLDPAYYGRVLTAQKQAITADKSLSDTDRIIKLAAIEEAEKKLPELQKMYREDTANFMIQTGQASTPEEAAIMQMKNYGISSEEVMTMSNEEAKVKADQLINKLPPEQAVAYVKSNAVNPATLRQIGKFIEDDSKGNLILYSAMASDSATAQIIAALKDWDNVQKAISQNPKMFPTNWKDQVIGDFQKNSVVKSYLADISKTSPQEATKLLDAMSSIYAARVYATGSNANKKAIIDDIAKNIIGVNFNTVTVKSPRQGNTSLNVSTAFQGNDLHKIKRVSDLVSSIGVNPNSIGLVQGVATGNSPVTQAVADEANISRKHQLDSMIKTSKLSGTPDGMSAMFTWEDAKGIAAGSAMYNSTTGKPIQIPYKEMVQVYNEAWKLKESWRLKGNYYKGGKTYSGNTFRVEHSKYARPGMPYEYNYGTKENPFEANEANAMNAALEYVLTNKYEFLNKTEYSTIKNTSTTKQMVISNPTTRPAIIRKK